MGIAAGALNRQAQFQRMGDGGDFASLGSPVWAAFVERRSTEVEIAEVTLVARTATLTIRDSAFARGITNLDRVTVLGSTFDVSALAAPLRNDGSVALELTEAFSPAQIIAAFSGEIAVYGSPVTLKRGLGTGAPEVAFKARLLGYKPAEMSSDVLQGDTKVIFLAEDLGDFPVPIRVRSADAIWQDGKKMTVQAVDDQTRRIAGVLVAYELRVRG